MQARLSRPQQDRTCGICLFPFSAQEPYVPVSLPCLPATHTFCRACLLECALSKHEPGLACPECAIHHSSQVVESPSNDVLAGHRLKRRMVPDADDLKELCTNIKRQTGFEKILLSMRIYEQQSSVQAAGCQTLCQIIRPPSSSAESEEEEANQTANLLKRHNITTKALLACTTTVLKAMRLHFSSEGVSKFACMWLSTLGVYMHWQQCGKCYKMFDSALAKAENVEVIARLANWEDADVFMHASKLMEVLARDKGFCQTLVGGAVDSLVARTNDQAERPGTDPELLLQTMINACNFVDSMAGHGFVKVLVEAGSFKLVLRALETLVTFPGASGQLCVAACTAAAGILCAEDGCSAVLSNVEERSRLVDEDSVIALLLSILENFGDSPSILDCVWKSFAALSESSDVAVLEAMRRAGVVQAAVTAIVNMPSDVGEIQTLLPKVTVLGNATEGMQDWEDTKCNTALLQRVVSALSNIITSGQFGFMNGIKQVLEECLRVYAALPEDDESSQDESVCDYSGRSMSDTQDWYNEHVGQVQEGFATQQHALVSLSNLVAMGGTALKALRQNQNLIPQIGKAIETAIMLSERFYKITGQLSALRGVAEQGCHLLSALSQRGVACSSILAECFGHAAYVAWTASVEWGSWGGAGWTREELETLTRALSVGIAADRTNPNHNQCTSAHPTLLLLSAMRHENHSLHSALGPVRVPTRGTLQAARALKFASQPDLEELAQNGGMQALVEALLEYASDPQTHWQLVTAVANLTQCQHSEQWENGCEMMLDAAQALQSQTPRFLYEHELDVEAVCKAVASLATCNVVHVRHLALSRAGFAGRVMSCFLQKWCGREYHNEKIQTYCLKLIESCILEDKESPAFFQSVVRPALPDEVWTAVTDVMKLGKSEAVQQQGCQTLRALAEYQGATTHWSLFNHNEDIDSSDEESEHSDGDDAASIDSQVATPEKKKTKREWEQELLPEHDGPEALLVLRQAMHDFQENAVIQHAGRDAVDILNEIDEDKKKAETLGRMKRHFGRRWASAKHFFRACDWD